MALGVGNHERGCAGRHDGGGYRRECVYGRDRSEFAGNPRAGIRVAEIPPFTVNLYLPKDGGSEIARELARYIRDAIIERHRMAA